MPGAVDDGTVTAPPTASGAAGPSRRRYLVLVLESHRPVPREDQPREGPVRVALDALQEVALGRGSSRSIVRDDEGGVRRLQIQLDDEWLSRHHARLVLLSERERWVLQDKGSKNGSFVNGERCSEAELTDGALIQLGRAFFLYREVEVEPPASDAPSVVDAGGTGAPAQGLITLSPSLAGIFERLVIVARDNVSVLLEGQTGTGKEVVARAIHDVSQRRGRFVAVDCGALTENLIESELFGHVKGAFSGSAQDRHGLIREADKGTLLLDEIGELPLPAQAAFLRVLQEREVRPVGADARPVPVDLRVVAATNRSLDRMVEAGTFRADLLARLAGYRVELPALGARREDMGLLLAALIRRAASNDKVLAKRLQVHPAAARAMLRYDWPANVRELGQCVMAALALARPSGRIELAHLPESVRRGPMTSPAVRQDDVDPGRHSEAKVAPKRVGPTELDASMRDHHGNVAAVARALKIHRQQVQRLLKRYGIDPNSYRS